MQTMENFLQKVRGGEYDDRLRRLYVFHDTAEELEAARAKVCHVIEGFEQAFPAWTAPAPRCSAARAAPRSAATTPTTSTAACCAAA